jgi:hypothetical protein
VVVLKSKVLLLVWSEGWAESELEDEDLMLPEAKVMKQTLAREIQ